MNILDKVINYISPSWAYKRMHWRMGIRQAYDAGKVLILLPVGFRIMPKLNS